MRRSSRGPRRLPAGVGRGGGVRLYAAGQPGGARADRLLCQAAPALDEVPRLKVVRECTRCALTRTRPRRSVDQLRGIEGVRVRERTRRWRAARRDLARCNYDPAGGMRRISQTATFGRDRLSLRLLRGGDLGRRVRAGDRLPASRQAAELCLRHRRCLQIRDRCSGRLRDDSQDREGAGDRGPSERQVRIACRDMFRRTNCWSGSFRRSTIFSPRAASATRGCAGRSGPRPAEVTSGDDGHRG